MNLTFRSRVEHASVPIVQSINRLPRVVVFLAVLALFVLAGLVGTWAWIPLLIIAAFVGWFLFLTWPQLTLPEKMMRTAVLLMVLVAAVIRAFPR